MPSTVATLFAAAGLPRSRAVPWGARIPAPDPGAPGTGIYVIAFTDNPDSMKGAAPTCAISTGAIELLLDVRPELTLDSKRPDAGTLVQRLTTFWCADEVVVYIGLAGPRRRVKVSELSDRVDEYYRTPLGARSPHAGGWPLKTLANLQDSFVHYEYCDDVILRERLMLDALAEGISQATRLGLYDSTHIMPFANLTASNGRKAHGIRGARAPRTSSSKLTA